MNSIRIFSSLTYYKEPNSFVKKLDPKASAYYLVGFIGKNIYKLYNPINNKTITTRDCVIIEGYYYKPNNSTNIQEVFTSINLDNNTKASNTNKTSYNSIDRFLEDKLANNISIIEEKPIKVEDLDSNSIKNIILNTIKEVNNK